MKLANRNVLIGAGVLIVLLLITNPTKDAYLDTLLTDQKVVTRAAGYICAKSERSMFFSKIEDCPPEVAKDKAAIKQFLDSRSDRRMNFLLFSVYGTRIDGFRLGGYEASDIEGSYGDVGILGNFTNNNPFIFFLFVSLCVFLYIVLPCVIIILVMRRLKEKKKS